MRISEKWNPEPDIFVIKPENYSKIKPNYFEGPADLVIEIISKSTRELDLTKKLPEFLKEGVKEVWIIDPDNQEVTVHLKDKQTKYSDPTSNEIIHSSVLPNLKFRLNWLWARDKFPINAVLSKI